MTRVILFDVNETLLDLRGLAPFFARVFGDAAAMQEWFTTLLHSSLVVTLTGRYRDFGVLAGAALTLLAHRHGVSPTEADRDEIRARMQQLSPHADVVPGLQRLKDAGLRLAVLTNSPQAMLEAQMQHSGLADFFEQMLSVDPLQSFKPAPVTYRFAAHTLGVKTTEVRFVAAHDWDVCGAQLAGCKGAYIDRHGRGYHPLYPPPDLSGPDLTAVTDRMLNL